MIIRTLLRRLFSRKEAPARRRAAFVVSKPQIELLENRLVPAWTVNDLTTLTATNLVQTLVGTGVAFSNVTYSGANVAAGRFTDTLNSTGIQTGVVLTSGSAQGVAGPNTQSNFSTSNST